MTARLKYLLLILAFLTLSLGTYQYFKTQTKSRTSTSIIRLNSATPSAVTKTTLLKFAVMSDIHSDLEHLTWALKDAKSDKMSFVIVTGDLTNVGESAELEAVKVALDKSGLKYYVIPGNHDVWMAKKVNSPIFSDVFGVTWQSFSDVGLKFILINNADETAGLPSAEMTWVKSMVTDCNVLKCLVFLHEPLNNLNSSHIMGEQSKQVASEAATLRQLFVTNNILQLFSGHLHFATEYVKNGLKTAIVGAVTGDRNTEMPRFLEVTWNGVDLKSHEVILE
ncbi:MAG: metallophosphoesterase [candidate division WWE3 bacterium]|nr:metallophosphoesterase [candidate division WWE3 bacterium]